MCLANKEVALLRGLPKSFPESQDEPGSFGTVGGRSCVGFLIMEGHLERCLEAQEPAAMLRGAINIHRCSCITRLMTPGSERFCVLRMSGQTGPPVSF